MYFSLVYWINLMYFSSDEVAVRCSHVPLISPARKYSWSFFYCLRGGIMYFPLRKSFFVFFEFIEGVLCTFHLMKLQGWVCSCCYYRLLGSTYDPAALIHFYMYCCCCCCCYTPTECCCLYRSSFCRACRLLAPNMLLHTASTQPPPPHLHIITLADWLHTISHFQIQRISQVQIFHLQIITIVEQLHIAEIHSCTS